MDVDLINDGVWARSVANDMQTSSILRGFWGYGVQ